MAHLGDGAHTRHGIGHTQAADFGFDVGTVEHGVLSAVGLHGKVHADFRQRGDDCLGAGLTFGINHAMVKRVEGDGAIHCARVDIAVADARGKTASHGAFARRREAVQSDDYAGSACAHIN